MDGVARAVEPLDELHDAPLVVKLLPLVAGRIGERDPHARIQESQFLQPAGEHVPGKLRLREDLRVGFERGLRASTAARAHLADGARRLAALVLLLPDVPLTGHLHLAPFRQEIHHRHAHAVEAAGGLVGPLLEFSTELQDRHDPFEGRDIAVHLLGKLRMAVDRDAAAVVLDRHAAVDIHRHGDVLGVACHALVDRVVDDLIDQVVQATGRVVADVHAEPLAHVVTVGEMLEIGAGVIGLLRCVCHGLWFPCR